MKYLLGYLEGIPDAPNLSDPEFQQLLVDVQAGKSQARANEVFYENLEKVLNELRSTPDSVAFHKPVSRRDAPNYYDVITKPMDFSTMSKNVKAQRYKSKADFAADLDLIWNNCLYFNTQESHPLRAVARMMKQKADHHLSFVAERTEKPSSNFATSVSNRRTSAANSVAGSASQRAGPTTHSASATLAAPAAGGEEEDAAGESDDAAGEKDESSDFQKGAKGAQTQTPSSADQDAQAASLPPESLGDRDAGRDRRAMSAVTNGHRPNGYASLSRQSPPPFRPKLQTTFDNVPALTRTPHSMTHFQALSLNQPGPSFSDKGKAKEVLHSHQPPSWFAASTDSEESRLEGAWWGYIQKDEQYTAGLPAVPQMVVPTSAPKRRTVQKRRRSMSMSVNGDSAITLVDPSPLRSTKAKTNGHPSSVTSTVPDLAPNKPVNLTNVVHRSVDNLFEARKMVGKVVEWQKAEQEGILLPLPKPHIEREERRQARVEWHERKRRRKDERHEAKIRARQGGEVGEKEAALSVRMATAGMLAQAGFEGANETAMDLMSRVVMDRIANLGKTFRLLIDGFSQKMSSEEMVLHALFENGQLGTADIEAHIKDDIEREDVKIREMSRRMRQGYTEVTTAPVIEDDMMFADNGEMLLDGNFADELGEDFLGLRDLGVAQEHGMQNLTVPTSIFYGRRKRQLDLAGQAAKEEGPEYPPPPPFVPLSATSYQNQLPALFHSFFAARIENGLGMADDTFDSTHSQIGPLGQIIIKNPPPVKKKPEVQKKPKPVKVVPVGPGKGNWIRPPKEERDRKAAEKKAFIAKQNGSSERNGSDEDAEGEEE